MIFVTVGSQKYQFNRLIKKVDELAGSGNIKETIFAQIGTSTYIPKNIEFERFMSREKLNEFINNSNLIISHAGVGVIMTAVLNNKKVIVVPRRSELNEHINNHQLEIAHEFAKEKLVFSTEDMDQLQFYIEHNQDLKFNKYRSNSEHICNIIQEYIEHGLVGDK